MRILSLHTIRERAPVLDLITKDRKRKESTPILDRVDVLSIALLSKCYKYTKYRGYMITNYELKKDLIKNGIYKIHKKCSYVLYKNEKIDEANYKTIKHNYRFGESKELLEPYKIGYITREFAFKVFDTYSEVEKKSLIQLANAEYHRVKRLRNKIEYMAFAYDELIFITLTFRNDVLKNTSYETRRRYVARYLKNNCDFYIANVDYGKKKEREHYHGLINKSIDPTFWIKNYGACKFLRVYKNDYAALSKYITKFTNHTLKETTKFIRPIYCR